MKTTLRVIVILVIILFTFGCQNDAQSKLEADNIDIVKKYWEAWNTQDIEVFKELYDHDNYFYSSTFDNPNPRNYDNTIENILWNWEISPDARNEVIDIFASGDKVASMTIFKGTYTNDIEGFPSAKGQELNASVLNVMRIKDGKIIEEWEVLDNAKFLEQIGIDCWPKE